MLKQVYTCVTEESSPKSARTMGRASALFGVGPGLGPMMYGPWACPMSFGMSSVLRMCHGPILCPAALSHVRCPCPMSFGPDPKVPANLIAAHEFVLHWLQHNRNLNFILWAWAENNYNNGHPEIRSNNSPRLLDPLECY